MADFDVLPSGPWKVVARASASRSIPPGMPLTAIERATSTCCKRCSGKDEKKFIELGSRAIRSDELSIGCFESCDCTANANGHGIYAYTAIPRATPPSANVRLKSVRRFLYCM